MIEVFLTVLIIMYVTLDINYLLRTYFTVLSGRMFQRKCSLRDDSTLYGVCTFLDCDIWFKSIRVARLVRELDFARYLFYDRTGIYHRSRFNKIRSLQGCTFTICEKPIPLFVVYKIVTKLVYWDDRSLFLEHRVITLKDNVMRYFFISRQYAIGENGESTKTLLESIPGSEEKPEYPDNIKSWLHSMKISSDNLRRLQ